MSESTPPSVASPTARRDRLANSLRALLSNDNIDLELFKPGAAWPNAEDLDIRHDESLLSPMPMPMPADPPPSPFLLPSVGATDSYASVAQSDSNPTSSDHKTLDQVPIPESTNMLDPALFLNQSYMGESGDFSIDRFTSWPREFGGSMIVDGSTSHIVSDHVSDDWKRLQTDPYCHFWTSLASSPPYDFFPDVAPSHMHMDVDMMFDSMPSLPAEVPAAESDCITTSARLPSPEPSAAEPSRTQQHQQHHQHQQHQQPSTPDSGPSNLPSAPSSPKPKSQRAHYVVERKYRTGLQMKFEALRDCITAYKRQQMHNQHQQQLSSRSCSSPREEVPEPVVNAKLNKADVLTSAVTCLEELQEENEVLIEHFKQLLLRFRAAKVTFRDFVGDHA